VEIVSQQKLLSGIQMIKEHILTQIMDMNFSKSLRDVIIIVLFVLFQISEEDKNQEPLKILLQK
jgi:hypothetical protein